MRIPPSARLSLAALTLLFSQIPALALQLPKIFSDEMVLQRGIPVPIWGTATSGEPITISFAGQSVTATTGTDGAWTAKLKPLTASATGRELTVKSPTAAITYKDVLVGEVWLCSGQSNMEKPLGIQRGQKPTENYQAELAAANYPAIRIFQVAKQGQRDTAPARDLEIPSSWTVCTGTALDSQHFSAIGYFFARELHKKLNIPIGIIHSSWGGTRIEPWTTPAGFAAVPTLADFAKAAAIPGTHFDNSQLGNLYDGMIAPLVPYAIRGVIWYQGESNVMNEDQAIYADKMEALITGWRAAWAEGNFPFYWVQLAPFAYTSRLKDPKPHSIDSLPLGWEAQAKALHIPHTGMAVITDLVSDLRDIHPIKKAEVAHRLALIAESKDYGDSHLTVSGPIYHSLKINGATAQITFNTGDSGNNGLTTRDHKSPDWFTIAGADHNFVDATAKITGNTVTVSSPSVPNPEAVRFGWSESAMPNLTNKAGLPASPFRTDSWPIASPTPIPAPAPSAPPATSPSASPAAN